MIYETEFTIKLPEGKFQCSASGHHNEYENIVIDTLSVYDREGFEVDPEDLENGKWIVSEAGRKLQEESEAA